VIRVGLVFEHDRQWMGGVNYYRNLLAAIAALPDRQIEPVIILGLKEDAENIPDLPIGEIVYSQLAVRKSPSWLVRKFLLKILSRDILLERLLKRHRVDVLSHSGCLGKRSAIPSISWVSDLQHRRMPQFFRRRERLLRDHTIGSWCRNCSAIILSSHDARQDMQELYPDCKARLEVLQFVSQVASAEADAASGKERPASDVHGKYFLVANQFWVHKNHRVVIDALALLKSAGRDVAVIATGNTHDYRQPGFYSELLAYAQHRGVTDNFSVPGMVPAPVLARLMRGAVAVINPSEFEGWNTAVEEAKSLGKAIILSDIPVHREQSPAYARYFKPHDAEALAEAMWEAWAEYDVASDTASRQAAQRVFLQRQLAFGRRYQEIVLGALHQ